MMFGRQTPRKEKPDNLGKLGDLEKMVGLACSFRPAYPIGMIQL
jgi:hypothetical protein